MTSASNSEIFVVVLFLLLIVFALYSVHSELSKELEKVNKRLEVLEKSKSLLGDG